MSIPVNVNLSHENCHKRTDWGGKNEELYIKIYELEVKTQETQQMACYSYEDRKTLEYRYMYLYM